MTAQQSSRGRSADERSILEGVLSFIEKKVQPIQAANSDYFDDIRLYFDGEGKESEAVVQARRAVRVAAAEAGYYNLFTPAELGGEDLGNQFFVHMVEEISERYGPGEPREPFANDVLANVFMGPGPIWLHATAELREKILPSLMAGEVRGSFGMSEPDSGSDVWGMRTKAFKDGDEWVINGSKQWTSWVADADYLFVFAVTDPAAVAERTGGISCFYVPTDTPGYRLESMIPLFGDPGGKEGILAFEDVRIPDAWRIGDVDDGLRMGFLTLTKTRLWQAARCIGEARWAFNESAEYAKVRHTFGKPISEHQSIQNLLADMAVDIYSSHTMAMDCARLADAGGDVRLETEMVKYHATNAGVRVFDSAMQIHGGMGVVSETRLFDGWRFARVSRITEGSDQIMQRMISTRTLRSGLPTW